METNAIGLRQQICMADNSAQIEALLAKGKTYEFAMEKTRRAWKRAAARRLEELKKAQ